MHLNKPSYIKGKWNKQIYKVIHELGRGANGIVYLVEHQDKTLALKVGEDSLSISSEVNVLKTLQKAQGSILGPSLYDVDDWQDGSRTRSFYTMNVIQGEPIISFVQQRGIDWIPVLMIQLLGFLDDLHQQGFIFGDLKPEHLLVTDEPPRLAWYDAGGITKIGRAIKEYTEGFDRGYWKMGSRRAEPSYDLFSVAMIIIYLDSGQLLEPNKHPEEQLKQCLDGRIRLAPYNHVIRQALFGAYQSALDMKKELMYAWHQEKTGKNKSMTSNSFRSKQDSMLLWKNKQQKIKKQSNLKQQKNLPKKRGAFSKIATAISFFFVSTFIILIFALYLFSQTLS